MSYSQLGQDDWVLSRIRQPGYYVEIGAHNGIEFSNTKKLEERGWRGLCVEPNRHSFQKLKTNRKCTCSISAVARKTQKGRAFYNRGAIGGFPEYLEQTKSQKTTKVNSLSLQDLFNKYNCPESIDYVSIDTEGSEIEILSSFDFTSRDIALWTIEHNDYLAPEQNRSGTLIDLFASHGYQHQLVAHDVWFWK